MDAPKTLEKPNSKKTGKQSEYDKMRDALSSIACEMKKFYESTGQSDTSATMLPDCEDKEKMLGELLKYKSKIRSTKAHIRKLRGNLKTACFVAKVVASAKKNDARALRWYSGSGQSQHSGLLERYKSNNEIVNNLSRENEILRHKYDNVAAFIRLGYEELQKIRNEPSVETSIFVQLKQLIKFCGEYYASYCNEQAERKRLEQKNNFLTNKIRLLENDVKALSEQLRTLNYRNFRLLRECDHIKNRCAQSQSCKEVKVAFSEVQMKLKNKVSTLNAANEVNLCKRESKSFCKINHEHDIIDLSPHLLLVEKLLCNQDTLLSDLKLILVELNKDYRS